MTFGDNATAVLILVQVAGRLLVCLSRESQERRDGGEGKEVEEPEVHNEQGSG